MEKFGVDIKFSGGETGNTVSVEGNEANVEECKEHLLELAEEMVCFAKFTVFRGEGVPILLFIFFSCDPIFSSCFKISDYIDLYS